MRALKVELIYDADCPNVENAREVLRRALVAEGLRPVWRQWDRAEPTSPAHVRGFGSPTILIEGKDVAGDASPQGADCCRIYSNADGRLKGVPDVELIRSALGEARQQPTEALDGGLCGHVPGSLRALTVLPSALVALIPVGLCPACWPIYAGLLSALGLGFLLSGSYQYPILIGLLALALVSLAYGARRRRGFGPFWAGLVAAGGVVSGKLLLSSTPLTYASVALLVAVSIWNAWPIRRPGPSVCPECLSGEPVR